MISSAGKLPEKPNQTGIRILVEGQGDKDRLSGLIADKLDGVSVGFVVAGKPGQSTPRPPNKSVSSWAAIPEAHAKVMDKYHDDMLALMSSGVNGFGYGVLPDENGNMPDLDQYKNSKPPLGIVVFTETKESRDLLAGFLRKSLDGVPLGVQAVGKIVAY